MERTSSRSGSPLPDKIEAASTDITLSASPRLLLAHLAPGGRWAGRERAFSCSTFPCSPLSPAYGRRAFTLVELLMVIVIIGILVALVTIVAVRAISTGREVSVFTEISQLSTAVESYKQKHGSYPPNPGTEPATNPTAGAETSAQREQRFMRHIRRAFPRYTGNLAQLRTDLQNATEETDQNHPNGFNIDTMDGAEALVFFLGGIPNRNESTWLNGFAADAKNPFQRVNRHPDDADPMDDPPEFMFQQQRTARLFEFDPTRLRDYDQDGWPEYVPNLKTAVFETAPYVYFDAGSYELGSHYPFTHFNSPAPSPDPATLWGFAVPYGSERDANATGDDPQDPTTWTMKSWQSPKAFQIICAGADGQYGGRNNPVAVPLEDWKRVFPSGEGYRHFNGGTQPPGYLDLDSDNMTNFAEKPIGEVEAPTSP